MVIIIVASILLSVMFVAIAVKEDKPVFLMPLAIFVPCLIIAGINLHFATDTHNQMVQKLEHPEIFKRSLEVLCWNNEVVEVKTNPWLYKWTVWDGAEYIVDEEEQK